MTKLTDLNGAREALPEVDAVKVWATGNNEKYYHDLTDIHLEVDVEAMAKAICLAEYPDVYIWDHLNENEKEFYRKLARGTSGTILEWARLVRK